MGGVHELADLAPRDVVAKAIVRRMSETGRDHVWLDARHFGAEKWRVRFPTILATLLAHGIDPVRDLIPWCRPATTPAAACAPTCTAPRASPGLFVCGESACTGVHGANRLASNSLLEGLVFGRRIADAVVERLRAPYLEREAMWTCAAEGRGAARRRGPAALAAAHVAARGRAARGRRSRRGGARAGRTRRAIPGPSRTPRRGRRRTCSPSPPSWCTRPGCARRRAVRTGARTSRIPTTRIGAATWTCGWGSDGALHTEFRREQPMTATWRRGLAAPRRGRGRRARARRGPRRGRRRDHAGDHRARCRRHGRPAAQGRTEWWPGCRSRSTSSTASAQGGCGSSTAPRTGAWSRPARCWQRCAARCGTCSPPSAPR